LILLGSALAVPIALRYASVASHQNRLAFVGHQLGVVLAIVGWSLSGRLWVGFGYAVWFAGAQAWFSWAGRASRRKARAAPLG